MLPRDRGNPSAIARGIALSGVPEQDSVTHAEASLDTIGVRWSQEARREFAAAQRCQRQQWFDSIRDRVSRGTMTLDEARSALEMPPWMSHSGMKVQYWAEHLGGTTSSWAVAREAFRSEAAATLNEEIHAIQAAICRMVLKYQLDVETAIVLYEKSWR